MPDSAPSRRVRFGPFELDPISGELVANGRRQSLPEQPLALLKALLARPGELVTREELQRQLWPGDTFVDFERGLNAAVKRLREALHDSADAPKFVETIPRRGYRLIVPVEQTMFPRSHLVTFPRAVEAAAEPSPSHVWTRRVVLAALGLGLVLAAGTLAVNIVRSSSAPATPSSSGIRRHPLTRVTFGTGLDTDPAWSPDEQSIVYSSDRTGVFNLWIQAVAGGDPRQLTHSPEPDTKPTWSPGGRNVIVYRSEREGGGLFAVPAEGGPEQRLTGFGSDPKWSPDGSRVLFEALEPGHAPGFYTVGLDGKAPQPVLEALRDADFALIAWNWHPNGRAVTFLGQKDNAWVLVTAPLSGAGLVQTRLGEECHCPFWSAERGVFAWAPSGHAVYVGCNHDFAIDAWKFAVDSNQVVVSGEPVTNGTGQALPLTVAPRSGRLAFTDRAMHLSVWAFPFDPIVGRITGAGRRVTDPKDYVFISSLSKDGEALVYGAGMPGTDEVQFRITDIKSGETRTMPPPHSRSCPLWAPDRQHVAYVWERNRQGGVHCLAFSHPDGSDAAAITTPEDFESGSAFFQISDWSADGTELLGTTDSGPGHPLAITAWPVAAGPHAEMKARVLAKDSHYDLYQGHLSPDGRWVAFGANPTDEPRSNRIEVIRSDARAAPERDWTAITEAHEWTDKPRWSPDGKTLFFTKREGLYLDLWGQRFDSKSGSPLGRPFRITYFDAPDRQLSLYLQAAEIGVSSHLLTLTMMERSGSIWVADNVDR
jgi:Tol biopolymer transport system component/DNA-binding winged helix-turn-helix (wHTH) protein